MTSVMAKTQWISIACEFAENGHHQSRALDLKVPELFSSLGDDNYADQAEP